MAYGVVLRFGEVTEDQYWSVNRDMGVDEDGLTGWPGSDLAHRRLRGRVASRDLRGVGVQGRPGALHGRAASRALAANEVGSRARSPSSRSSTTNRAERPGPARSTRAGSQRERG